jgi:hypothetical protein
VNLPLAAAVIVVALRHIPETRDPGADHRLDVPGAALCAVGLAGLTWASIAAGEHGASRVVLATGVVGVLGVVAFVWLERRSRHPLVPAVLFSSRQFTMANLFTFVVYAALGAVFFLLVLDLQIVGGHSPLAAGMSMLPVTAVMLVLSPRAGAIAQRIGPKAQLTAGPLIAAMGLLLTLRIGPQGSYVTAVLPAVTLFGLGLAVFVAPLTASVLAAAPPQHVGVASALNNAVARAGGLLAVALVPPLVGLSGDDYRSPVTFAEAYRGATLINLGLLLMGSVVAAVGMTNEVPRVAGEPGVRPEPRAVTHAYSCALEGPRLETIRCPSPDVG